MTTVLNEFGEVTVPDAEADGAALWLPEAGVEDATGWSLKPEGFCKGTICVLIDDNKREALLRDGKVDIAGLWRHVGRPVVSAEGGDVWALGNGAEDMGQALMSLEAPNFTLPDLAGNLHSLSDYRGKKVFLSTWASW